MISFSCEMGKLNSGFIQDKHGSKDIDIFPVLEQIVNDVKRTVNSSEDSSNVKMVLTIDGHEFCQEVYCEEDKDVFNNILIDSFYGMAATVMDHLGIEGYEFPESFEKAIYSN